MEKELLSVSLNSEPSQLARLQEIADSLAKSFDAPRFIPHLTLLKGEFEYRKTVEAIKACSSLSTPIATQAIGIGHTDLLFKTLFIELDPKPLDALVNNLSEFIANPKYIFEPHISLLYKKLPTDQKEKLSKDLLPKLDKLYNFNTISILRRDQNKPDSIKDWHFANETSFLSDI